MAVAKSEPGRDEWKQARNGRCSVCGMYQRVILHHVVPERLVRDEGGDPWDQRNAMVLGAPIPWGGRCSCHSAHHLYGVRDTRIPMSNVPQEAQDFARELLGEERADLFFARHYRKEEG